MIDLHLHLDGSLNPRNIFKMAEMAGVELTSSEVHEIEAEMTVEPGCTNLGEYLEKFDLALSLLQTPECIEYAIYELMRDLEEQGLLYAEIRFAPQLHLKRGLTQQEVVSAAIRARNRGKEDFGINVNLILCCMRSDSNRQENLETVSVAEKFLAKGVCAIDLAGNEAAYPTESFKDVFLAAREKGIPAIIHAGEAAGPESIRHALEMGALRIGHGIRALEDTALIDTLCEKGIYLEMCYSSNLQTKTVERAEDYPLVKFLSYGIGVTLNTDNLTVSGTSLRREYSIVQKAFSLSDDMMRKIALNSADATFLPADEKEALKKQIDKEFISWLHGTKRNEEKEMDTNYLCEQKLKNTSPELHTLFGNSVFSLQQMLNKYKNIFPTYTDHTVLHSIEVVDFCNKLIGGYIEKLNADELYILLMAAYLHDSGMGISESDFESFSKNIDFGNYFETHPESTTADTIRDFHQEFSAEYIKKYAPFMEIPSEEHIFAIVQVSRGHRKVDLWDKNEYPADFRTKDGTTICLPYLAALIRLADELDIAADRNLQFMYDIEMIDNEFSKMEFKKHQAIKQLLINKNDFTLVVDTSDEDVYQGVIELSGKLNKTLLACKAVVEARTPYRITQSEILIEPYKENI